MLSAGEEVVAQVTAPFPIAVVDGPKIRLVAMQQLEGNKKLPPRTILVRCSDLQVGPAGSSAASFEFSFDKTKTTYVQQSGVASLITLHDLIEKSGAKGIAKHTPWTGGTPTSVVAQSSSSMMPASRTGFWQKVSRSESLGVAWVLKLTDKKILTPTGIVAYNVKQLIIPSSGTLALV